MGTLNKEGIGLGTFVQRRSHEMRGRVIDVHFTCPENVDWVMAQEPPIRAEALMPGYVWFTVLVHGGGSVVVPAYDVEVVGGFAFSNDWATEYFPWLCEDRKHVWDAVDGGPLFRCGTCGHYGKWNTGYQMVMFVRGSELTDNEKGE